MLSLTHTSFLSPSSLLFCLRSHFFSLSSPPSSHLLSSTSQRLTRLRSFLTAAIMASQVRAAEITQDWDPDNQTGLPTNLEHPFFRVTNGTEGWIHATGHGFCLFEPIDDPDKQGMLNLVLRWLFSVHQLIPFPPGLIPETILKKGLKNKTPLPIVQPLRTESASASTYPRRANNVLHQMLRDLWEIIGENREQIVSSLPGMSPGAMSAMFAFDAHTYADVIYDCEFLAAFLMTSTDLCVTKPLHGRPATSCRTVFSIRSA